MDFSTLAIDGIISSERYLATHPDVRALTAAVASGELIKLRRGAYVLSSEWRDSDERSQHLLRARAVLADGRGPRTLAGLSAAAAWGMWVDRFPEEVTVLDSWRGGGRSEPGTRKVTAAFASAATTTVNGFPVTTVSRTALDVARRTEFTRAIGSIDWALRDKNPVRVSIAALLAELDKFPVSVGKKHLEKCVRFGTSVSGSYGESMARAVMFGVGFEAPELQVRFDSLTKTYFADFLWRRFRVIVEFDGKGKYLNDDWTGGDPGQTVWEEKLREDYLRSLGYTVVRLYWADLLNPQLLIAKLEAAGLTRGRR
jgi:hypothetical protein